MSTPDIPDDELDDFFRKSLGKPDLDFREEDWLKMEQKLKDKHAHERAFYRRFLYRLIGLLLVMAPVLTWYVASRPTQPAVPMTAVRENGDTENSIGNTNTPNSTGNTIIPRSKNDIDTVLAPAPNQPVAEKGDGNKSDIISPSGDRTDPVAEKEGIKQKKDSQPLELLSQEQPIEVIPSARKKTGAAGKIAETRERHGKEKTLKETTPVQSGLPSGKPEQAGKNVNTKTKKESRENGLNKQPLTPSQKNKPVENQPSGITGSGIIVIGSNRNKQPSKKNNEKGNTDSPVSGKSVTKQDIQEQNTNNTASEPTGIIPRQNRQEGSHSTQKEAALPDSDYSNTQPTARYLIESISSPSTRPLSYEIQLTDLISRHAIPLLNTEQWDSTGRNKLAIERLPSRLSVNLLLSPDLSSIGFSKWRTPGTNFGVSLEYHISNRVSVIVGAIYSTKIYAADASKYNPDNPYWASYYPKPVNVKGNCKVIDLPINIRYNVLAKEKYNIYLSGGVSSYLMLREDYKYIYDVDDTNLRPGWHGKNENKHFFKVINLSAGYERKLNQRFSLQAEPFIKLPTAGVGYGRIKLLSTGLFMSVKYNF